MHDYELSLFSSTMMASLFSALDIAVSHHISSRTRSRSSLDYSRRVKEKGHRVSRRCYRSGVEAFLYTVLRRLDGHSLYSASHVPIRAEREADRGRVRHPDASSD